MITKYILWHIVARGQIAPSLDRFSRYHDPRYVLPTQIRTDQCISSMSCEQGLQLTLELPLLVAIVIISVLAMKERESSYKR